MTCERLNSKDSPPSNSFCCSWNDLRNYLSVFDSMEPIGATSEHDDLKAGASSPCSSMSFASSDESSEKISSSSYQLLGSSEDLFIQAGLNLTTVPELTEAVDTCKAMVLNTKEYSEERKWLVRYLIELRLRLEEAREAESEQKKMQPIGTPELSPTKFSSAKEGILKGDSKTARDKRIILGHHFLLQAPDYNVQRCDCCCGKIWGVLHLWYQCSDCLFKCHMRCLEKIKRQCAYVQVCETPFYSNDICPEVGLAAQGYRCHDCKCLILNSNGWHEPRQCDYDGLFYCTRCHWNTTSVIPARVVHNWDFSERKVCRNCYSFLRLMITRPVINLDILNPQLFQFVADLAAVKKYRSQFLLMKQYLTTCPNGLKEKSKKKLIWSLNLHFIENPAGLFSLKDLISVQTCAILPVLQEVAQASTEHIRSCWMCKEKGYFCELCPPRKKTDEDDIDTKSEKHCRDEILFPFDDAVFVYVCGKCSAVFHRDCWSRKNLTSCPRCERLQKKRCLLQQTSE